MKTKNFTLFVFLLIFLQISVPNVLALDKTLYIGKADIPDNIWGSNPFLTEKEERILKGEPVEIEENEEVDRPDIMASMMLEAIFFSKSRKVAIINGQVIKPGDTILGYEVLEINENNVVIEIDRERRVLPLSRIVENIY